MKYEILERNNTTLIKIDNENNLKCELSSFGAGVYSMSFKGEPIILTLKDYGDYMYSSQLYGKTLGVVAGRLKKDGYILDKEYHLKPESGKEFALHGGNLDSISFKNWKYKITESKRSLHVIFSIATKLNANGFPGKARIYVTYEFNKLNDEMKIIFKATTPSEATFVNLTNHIYWNFAKSKDISNYSLKMNCSKVAITDENLLILGKEDVPNRLNFIKASKLNPKMNDIEKHDFKKTIDDTFIFDDSIGKVILKNDFMRLTLTTDCSSMNIYVDNTMTPLKFKNRDDFEMRRGIALEPQRFILDKNEITLKKGEIYKNYIQYKFK